MGTAQSQWQPIYFGIISVSVVLSILHLWLVAGCADCAGALDYAEKGGGPGAARGVAIVSFMEVFRIMVMLPADYLRLKLIEPLKEQYRGEGMEKGREEGRKEGVAEGIAEGEARGEARMRAQFVEWLIRKADAERLGVPFDEPMPGADSGVNGHSPRG